MKQDLYTGVHKAIRALIADAARRVQTADYESRSEREAVAAALRAALAMVSEHGTQEERFIHSRLRAVAPELVAMIEAEHHALDELREVVTGALRDALAAPVDRRAAAWAMLDRAISRWTAAHLSHMVDEEESLLPATWKHFSNEQLVEIRTAMQRDTKPLHYERWLRWFVRGMSNPELAALLIAVRESPPEIYATILGVARDELGPRWDAVRERARL